MAGCAGGWRGPCTAGLPVSARFCETGAVMPLFLRSTSFLLLAGAVALPACAPDVPPEHGYVKVQFRRSESEAESPFTGTQEVEVNLTYDACLSEFYEANPNYASDGLDGAEVFAKFSDDGSKKGLCRQKGGTRTAAQCDTLNIEQDLDNNRIRTRYRITEQNMEDKVLSVGPIPCEELTGCEGIVSGGAGSGNGFGIGGAQAWVTTSFPERDAICGQGLPIELKVARPGG